MQEAKAAQMDTHDVPAVVKLASKEFHITDSESTGVLQRLIESNDLTLYGLSNAVTRHSQDVESYDRASELESIGYSILTMPAPAVVENQPGSRLMLPSHTGGFFMSMMNANAAATTAMTANEPLDFVLPEMGDADFSSEELAEDTDGSTMSFPRIKIPAGGVLQFELPTGDPQHPDYRPTLTGVILFNHASCAYWPEGDEYSDDVPPLCSSVDGKQGYGETRWYLRSLRVESVWQRQQRSRQSLQEHAGAVSAAQWRVYAAGNQPLAYQHQPVPRVLESGLCFP